MAVELGSLLGTYEIVSLLGVGGMGEVYRARDTKLQREVALKVLPDAFASDSDRLARFQREAQLLASLNHANIAVIHGIEEARPTRRDGVPTDGAVVRALVLELIDGETVADRIARGALPLDEAFGVARQIIDALAAAHGQGVIHRDLKPANIKVRADGTVKVLDFGLAKALENGVTDSSPAATLISPAVTRHGVFLGTAAYMSPEQARGRAADARSDIWAFGCVLLEMLTGTRAFAGEEVSDTMAAVLRAEPEWAQLPADTPSSIRRLLKRCLEKDPKRRLADIRDARLELDDAHDAQATTPTKRQGAWRERAAWTITALAIAAAGFVAWGSRPPTRAGPAPTAVRLSMPAPDGAAFASSGQVLSLSPDGRSMALVMVGSDSISRIGIRPLDAATVRLLPGTEGASNPFWSPDGRNLGFFADGSLKRISADGVGVQVLAAADRNLTLGASWGSSDVILFAPGLARPIQRVSSRGGEVATVIDTRAGISGAPFFLPDGRHFIYVNFSSPTGGIIHWASIDGTEDTALGPTESPTIYAAPGHLLYARSGTLLAHSFDATRGTFSGEPLALATGTGALNLSISSSPDGTLAYLESASLTRLEWVDRTGQLTAVAAPPSDYGSWSLSPDDRRIAFDRTVENGSVDVWVLDQQRQISSRLTSQGPANNIPLWSPDGASVAFASSRNDSLDIYRRAPSGAGNDERIVEVRGPPIVFPSDWSRDGTMLAYYRTIGTQLDTWIQPLEPGGEPFPFLDSQFDESQGQFSPDSNWLAYVSNESGEQQVYVTNVRAPAGREQISTDGGSQPRWNPDGRELFYVAADGKLMATPVQLGATFTADTPRPLFDTELARAPLRQTYEVSTDGQRFLLQVPAGNPGAAINIVLNWPALLQP